MFECLLLTLKGLAWPQGVPEEDWQAGCGERRQGRRAVEKGVCGGGGGVVSGLVGRAERAVGGIPGGLPAGGVRGMSTWAKQQNNEESGQ